MKRYFIEVGGECVPQIRELSNQEYNLISSIFESAQNGIIEEYPFNYDDVVSVSTELSTKRTRNQKENFLWKEPFKRYPNVRPEIMRYFISEVECYNLLNTKYPGE